MEFQFISQKDVIQSGMTIKKIFSDQNANFKISARLEQIIVRLSFLHPNIATARGEGDSHLKGAGSVFFFVIFINFKKHN